MNGDIVEIFNTILSIISDKICYNCEFPARFDRCMLCFISAYEENPEELKQFRLFYKIAKKFEEFFRKKAEIEGKDIEEEEKMDREIMNEFIKRLEKKYDVKVIKTEEARLIRKETDTTLASADADWQEITGKVEKIKEIEKFYSERPSIYINEALYKLHKGTIVIQYETWSHPDSSGARLIFYHNLD